MAIQITDTTPTEEERLAALVPNAGTQDGTVWTDVHGEEVKVVYEYDEANEVTGWHVEPQGRDE